MDSGSWSIYCRKKFSFGNHILVYDELPQLEDILWIRWSTFAICIWRVDNWNPPFTKYNLKNTLTPLCTAKQRRNALFPYIPSSCTFRGFQLDETGHQPFIISALVLQKWGSIWWKIVALNDLSLVKKKTKLKTF